MNPHQQNKVDISSLSPDEQRLLRLYGKVPTKKDLLQNKLKERKYFDSGDYALSKAGKASDIGVTNVGSRHPVPENIPHLTSTSPGANNPAGNNGNNGAAGAGGGGAGPGTAVTQAHPIPGSLSGHPGSVSFQNRSPVKEASFLQRGTAVDDSDNAGKPESRSGQKESDEASVSPPPAKEGVPIPQ